MGEAINCASVNGYMFSAVYFLNSNKNTDNCDIKLVAISIIKHSDYRFIL